MALLRRLPKAAGLAAPAAASADAALRAVDAALASPVLDPRWLPRAAALVPQLLGLLRQPEVSQSEVVAKVSRDPVLTSEVMRVAQGAFYARRGPLLDLNDALSRLGVQGLQMAISRVLLRPLFDADRAPELAPLQALLQTHADWQAEAMAQAARELGLPPIDGYLAGLLHGAGWQALLRIVAAQEPGWAPLSPDPALAAALADRAHRLFGLAAQGWGLSDSFSAFVQEAQAGRWSEGLAAQCAALQAASPALA